MGTAATTSSRADNHPRSFRVRVSQEERGEAGGTKNRDVPSQRKGQRKSRVAGWAGLRECRCRGDLEIGKAEERRTSAVGPAGVGRRPTCCLSRNLSAARLSGKVHALGRMAPYSAWRGGSAHGVELARRVRLAGRDEGCTSGARLWAAVSCSPPLPKSLPLLTWARHAAVPSLLFGSLCRMHACHHIMRGWVWLNVRRPGILLFTVILCYVEHASPLLCLFKPTPWTPRSLSSSLSRAEPGARAWGRVRERAEAKSPSPQAWVPRARCARGQPTRMASPDAWIRPLTSDERHSILTARCAGEPHGVVHEAHQWTWSNQSPADGRFTIVRWPRSPRGSEWLVCVCVCVFDRGVGRLLLLRRDGLTRSVVLPCNGLHV